MLNPIRRVRPEKTGVRAPLGDLEMAVMRRLWECGPNGCLAADVQRALHAQRPVAVTTVLTTLDRLCKKGIARREQEGRPFRFFAAVTEDRLEQRIVEGVLEGLIAQFPHAVATYFAQQGLSDSPEEGMNDSLKVLAEQIEAIRGEESSATTDGGSTARRDTSTPSARVD